MNASKMLGLLVAVSALLQQGECRTEVEATAMEQLTTNLLNVNPQLTIPPSPDGSEGPVVVKIGFSLYSVSDLNEQGYMDMVGLLSLQWTDTRLRFDPSDYAHISTAYLPYDKIWKPDIELYNPITPGMTLLNHELPRLLVDHTGHVTMIKMVSTRSSCDVLGQISGTNSVVDCKLRFGSWVYGADMVDLEMTADEVDTETMAEFQDVGKWTVVSTRAERKETIYACCPDAYPSVDFTLSIKKREV